VDVRWWGLLVANCAANLAFWFSKESIDYRGKRVNQLSAGPLREAGKTLQYTWVSVVYMDS